MPSEIRTRKKKKQNSRGRNNLPLKGRLSQIPSLSLFSENKTASFCKM